MQQSVNQRLKMLVDSGRISRKQLMEALHVKKQTITGLLKDENINEKHLFKLEEKLRLSKNYMETGDGPVFLNESTASEPPLSIERLIYIMQQQAEAILKNSAALDNQATAIKLLSEATNRDSQTMADQFSVINNNQKEMIGHLNKNFETINTSLGVISKTLNQGEAKGKGSKAS